MGVKLNNRTKKSTNSGRVFLPPPHLPKEIQIDKSASESIITLARADGGVQANTCLLDSSLVPFCLGGLQVFVYQMFVLSHLPVSCPGGSSRNHFPPTFLNSSGEANNPVNRDSRLIGENVQNLLPDGLLGS